MSAEMSDTGSGTTGNEFEQPGVNYPDREDAAGAGDTPGEGDAVRSDAGRPVAEAPTEGGGQEPSHEAVGIGVIDADDHHGQDQGRETLTVSEAQRTPGALGERGEQRLPAMDQNNASELEKITGIVAQTRSDMGTEPLEAIEHSLAQRLEQAGLQLSETDVSELAHQVSTGDASSPQG